MAVCMAAGLLLVSATGAFAAGGVSLCIPEAENAATVTPTKGACPAKYRLTELGAEGKEGKAGKEGKEGKEGTFAGLTTADKETLLAVLPYLVVKREQAVNLLEFVRLPRDMNPEKRREFWERQAALNKRGIGVTTNMQDNPKNGLKIESGLAGDRESDPIVMSEPVVTA